MLDRGYWRPFTIANVAVLVHWTVPVGAILFSRLELVPGAWIAYAIVLAAHALGHAAMARAVGGTPVAVYVTGLGGECAWRGPASRSRESAVAWGGIAGQLVVLGAALVASTIKELPPLLDAVVRASISSNLALAAANLLPIPGFDGVQAWGFVIDLWTKRRGADEGELTADDLEALDDDPDADDPEVDEVVDRLLRDATRRKDD